ncbi:50S ribosomal protein L18 [Candidatus Gracilibacteria bacterium]|nr:MAG: 50S ribosomal protein L18 [Candidatus Gracilibacteria bacterium]PIE85745.1 MAG: 50S ribosomal protein L18 [Candidatus Gracilibacteria bacterium]
MLDKIKKRLRRKAKIKARIVGTSARPRLAVYRSNASIYAQIIDDVTGKTLCSSSDLKIKKGTKSEKAKEVGVDLAKKAKDLKITDVVFDRGGFIYHGRVKALADSAREGGLKF